MKCCGMIFVETRMFREHRESWHGALEPLGEPALELEITPRGTILYARDVRVGESLWGAREVSDAAWLPEIPWAGKSSPVAWRSRRLWLAANRRKMMRNTLAAPRTPAEVSLSL